MKSKTVIFVLVVLTIAGAFYWFQVRPAQFRRKCSDTYYALEVMTKKYGTDKTIEQIKEDIKKAGSTLTSEVMNTLYRDCLATKGIKPEDLY